MRERAAARHASDTMPPRANYCRRLVGTRKARRCSLPRPKYAHDGPRGKCRRSAYDALAASPWPRSRADGMRCRRQGVTPCRRRRKFRSSRYRRALMAHAAALISLVLPRF